MPNDSGTSERVDGSTLKMWVHYILTAVPEGDTVVLNLSETSVLNHEGNWDFSVSLDGSALRAGATRAKAGEYPVGDNVLLLDNFTFGPLGGSITFKNAVRFEKGEGIEKKQENFAEEIAKQLGK